MSNFPDLRKIPKHSMVLATWDKGDRPADFVYVDLHGVNAFKGGFLLGTLRNQHAALRAMMQKTVGGVSADHLKDFEEGYAEAIRAGHGLGGPWGEATASLIDPEPDGPIG